jgi:hypothetical protein
MLNFLKHFHVAQREEKAPDATCRVCSLKQRGLEACAIKAMTGQGKAGSRRGGILEL